ncbi:FAD/NAD(P)-binding protein [Aureimonas frigidaquae]|uniref:FAD/NAD(P)-binding protein n=1 Tax=Aureimonas frigidaquae TaxID=424757 RepID=UPI0007819ED2|nr:FAD/NAD(P)-binding protein [Aureimonas frigidaquae]
MRGTVLNAGSILIVGGGASGAILAAHLLRFGDARLRVTILERRSVVGAGIAYSTDEPDHLLNTRASGMSAWPDDPDHFWRWLQADDRGAGVDCRDPFCFVPRRVYRAYLSDVLAPFLSADGTGRLRIVEGECVDLAQMRGGVAVELADGRTELAGVVVLATGHAEPEATDATGIVGPWEDSRAAPLPADAPVAILGTGLSMVDNVARLRRTGHHGPITALSRRGLLPLVHARASTPFRLDAADIPFGTSVAYLTRWLRGAARWHGGNGGDWRDLMDAVRPHTQAIWQSMSIDSRARFLRHARTFWEIHRHRMAPQAAEGIAQSLSDGQLRVLAGRVVDKRQEGDTIHLALRLRGGEASALAVRRVIDCTGILRDPLSGRNHLMARLVEAGEARLDPLRIGIETDAFGALVDRRGAASRRLLAVGPVTRALFWEVTAIPDIRLQCAALARRLIQEAGRTG